MLPNEKHEFSTGWRAAQKGRPAGCAALQNKATLRRTSGLQKCAGQRAVLFCSPPHPFPQPAFLCSPPARPYVFCASSSCQKKYL